MSESAAHIRGPVLEELYHAYTHPPTEEIREATGTPALQLMDVQVYTRLQIGITAKSRGPFRGAEEFARQLEPFHETAGRNGRGFLPWALRI